MARVSLREGMRETYMCVSEFVKLMTAKDGRTIGKGRTSLSFIVP